jgi:hypothetical protein
MLPRDRSNRLLDAAREVKQYTLFVSDRELMADPRLQLRN